MPSLGSNVFAFFDPPYIENGESLYLNNYEIDDHRHLAVSVGHLAQPWVVTYRSGRRVGTAVHQNRRIVYGLPYSAQSRYRGREVMFLSDNLTVPVDWPDSRRFLLTPPRSEYPLYGMMENMKPHSEMEEGPAAFERFQKAAKTVLSIPKTVLPPRPSRKKKRPTSRKG